MSKLRSISTAIWSDTWFEELNPTEKLLFIYLITNEKNNMLGVYEICIKKISFDTGLTSDNIRKALKGFERVGKVKYDFNYIVLLNYLKHQKFNSNMMKSAIDIYNELPKELKLKDIVTITERNSKGFETLCKGFGMVRKVEVEDEEEEEDKKEDKDLEERQNEFKKECEEFIPKYHVDMVTAFYAYWSEPNNSKTKMKKEMQQTWDTNRRLITWKSRTK